MLTPREYQLEALEVIAARRSDGISRQLVSLPTGCGKTIIFALLAKALNVRTIIIAHTQELITQAIAKLKIVWPEVDVGIVKADSDNVNAQVVVASIQTASKDKRLQRLKQQGFGLLIIDEAHHSAALSYTNVMRELGFFDGDPNKLLVGVTATPKRGDGIGLGSVFEEIVFERSMSTMIRAGYLSSLVGKQIFTKVELESVGIRSGDFIPSELSRMVNTEQRNQLIVDNYMSYAHERKKTLVFAVDVAHAKELAEVFVRNGIPAKAVYGGMDNEDRESTLKDFSEGKYRVLTNCQLLAEGFDEPSIDCVIMGRPTRSSALFTQMIGRGTRTFPTKKDCLILDFCDNSAKHDLCTYKNMLDGAVATLFDQERDDEIEWCVELDSDDIIDCRSSGRLSVRQGEIKDIEFFDSAQFAWTPVGDSWHLNLGQNRDVWVRQVNGGFLVVAQSDGDIVNLSNRPLPLDYALGVAEDWSRKQTTKSAWARKDAVWRSHPATQKQIETLGKLGIEFNYGISKGDAAQLLDLKINEPATDKQIYWLRKHRIAFDPRITKFEARKIISTYVR